jgi:hypothetical protein
VRIESTVNAHGLQSVTHFTKNVLCQLIEELTLNLWRLNLNRYPVFTEEVHMMMFRKISVCLLLLSAMMSASARSDRAPDERGERRAPPPSQYEPQRGQAPDQQWQNRGRGSEPNDGGRGRMSPDDRRALRQQIDRAGRDIYPQRR